MIIAFIGGTGPEGKGLAYRFALAGHEVVIGSRSAERGAEAAQEIAERVPEATVRGADNATAAREGELIVLTIPFEANAATLPPLVNAVKGKPVVSSLVPLTFERKQADLLEVPEGSAAELVRARLPGARVVGAFQNLGAKKLWQEGPLEQDIIVCSDDDGAKRQVMELSEQIEGARAVDGGPLHASLFVEGITALLINVNRRYKATTGVRVTGLP